MKKIGFLLLLSFALTACQDDKPKATEDAAKPAEAPTAESSGTTTEATAPQTEEKAEVNETGESIHKANCTSCHSSDVYTRSDRKVTSLDQLAAQVRMCDSQLETQLFPEDLEKVITYLNDTYYKF